jgi:hypothetical protein
MPTTNTLFAVIAVAHPEALEAQIRAKFPDLSMEARKGQWFIVAPSTTTTTELSNQLGITEGTSSAAIVLNVASYYGRTNPATWEWIAAQMGAAQNANQAS